MRVTLWILLLGCATALADSRELSLAEALALAKVEAPSLASAALDSSSSALSRNLARAEWLPSLVVAAESGLSSSDTESDNPNVDSKSDSRSHAASLLLDWPLFQGFAGQAESRRQMLLGEQGELEAARAADLALLGVAQAWYGLHLAERNLSIAEESVELSRNRVAQDSMRVLIGGGSAANLLNARLALNTDLRSLSEARRLRDAASAGLASRLGRKGARASSSGGLPPDRDLSDAAAFERAVMQGNYRLRSQRSSLAQSAESRRIARSGLYPTLSLEGSAGMRSTHTDPESGASWDSDNTNWSAGVGLSWPLYTGGSQSVARQRASIGERKSRLALQALEAQVAGEWQSAYSAWQNRREQLELAASSRVLAGRQLDLREEEYELGRTGALDFRDAQLSLANARRAEVEARVNLQLVRMELEMLRGTLGPFLDELLAEN